MDKNYLKQLADKYEVSTFCNDDPSQFLHWYPASQIVDTECAAFIAAMLSFGNRKQFIPKIKSILTLADKTCSTISKWILQNSPDFPNSDKKFYRFYSYNDMHALFSDLKSILEKSGSLGEYMRGRALPLASDCDQSYATPSSGDTPQRPDLSLLISQSFANAKIVPKGKTCANKRIHMFLRWMVRQNSPVDLGIWKWYPQSKLLIPLDVHVMKEGIRLGLLPPNATANKKTAILLTKKMEEFFPGDPSRADYALFGLGVTPSSEQ